MWSAILVALFCVCSIRNERKQGCGPKGDKVLFIHLFVCPSICLSPQALSDLKSALSGLKSTLSGLKSALSGLESVRAVSGLRGQIQGLIG